MRAARIRTITSNPPPAPPEPPPAALFVPMATSTSTAPLTGLWGRYSAIIAGIYDRAARMMGFID